MNNKYKRDCIQALTVPTFWHRLKWPSVYPQISLIPTQISVHLQTDKNEILRRDFEIRFVDLFLDKDGLMSIHFHLIVERDPRPPARIPRPAVTFESDLL